MEVVDVYMCHYDLVFYQGEIRKKSKLGEAKFNIILTTKSQKCVLGGVGVFIYVIVT